MSESVERTPSPALRAPESGLLAAAAFVIPLIAAAGLNRGAALFRSDVAVLAALDGGASLAGSFGRGLGQLAQVLPLGNQTFRLALPSALGLAFFSVAIARFSRALFAAQKGRSRLDPWLATGAGLAAAMHLWALGEGSTAGGSVWGPAWTAYLLSRIVERGAASTRRDALYDGVLLGLALAESPWCALVGGVSILCAWPELRARDLWTRDPWQDAWRALQRLSTVRLWQHVSRGGALVLAATAVVGLLWLPVLLTTSAEHLSHLSAEAQGTTGWEVFDWAGRVGLLWTAAAIVGATVGLDDRRGLVAVVLAIGLDWLVPHAPLGGWTHAAHHESSRVALHLLTMGLVAGVGALGLRTAVETARGLDLMGARHVSILVAIVAVAGSLARAEDAVAELTETATQAADVWTDEALGGLPRGALVLTHGPQVGRRLLSAQATGERPDVLVIPISELTDARRVTAWLQREPALDLLLRDLSLSETPSERAVARLVDARPVAVEPDPSWDRRLLEHLWPGIPLARMSAHALGRSDRRSSLDQQMSSSRRMLSSCAQGLVPDRATQGLLRSQFDALESVFDQIDHGSLELLRSQGEELTPTAARPPEGAREDRPPGPLARVD